MTTGVVVDLPYSDEAERSVLGAILVDNAKAHDVAPVLKPEDFYRTPHQRIYRTMISMTEAGQPIDLLTLSEHHAGDDEIGQAGGASYLSRLMDGIPRMTNVIHYARIVRDRADQRRILRSASALAADAADPGCDLPVLLERHGEIVDTMRLERESLSPRGVTMKAGLGAALDDLDSRRLGETEAAGVMTGFPTLDRVLGGLQPQTYTVLGGRTSIGKSALASALVEGAAERGARVLIISLEMTARAIHRRMLARRARVTPRDIQEGRVDEQGMQRIINAYQRMVDLKITIDDRSTWTPESIRARAMAAQAEGGLDVLLVDHLGEVKTRRHHESRVEAVTEISSDLRAIAKDLGIAVLAVVQLNREAAKPGATGVAPPSLVTIRDADTVAHHADVVLLVHRPGYHDREKDQGEAQLIVAKHRDGAAPTIPLRWDGAFLDFREAAREYEDGRRDE